MRWAQSYSIIDHQILHGRYLHRLTHEAMALYLFLVVVGDRQGQSFYADRSITEILRLSGPKLDQARKELIQEGLIRYPRPYWEVQNLPQRRDRDYGRDDQTNHPLPSRRPQTQLPPNPKADRDFAKAGLAHISEILSGGEKKKGIPPRSLPPSGPGVVPRLSEAKGPPGPRMANHAGRKD